MAAGETKNEFRERVRRDRTLSDRVLADWKAVHAPLARADECWTCALRPTKRGGYVQGSWGGHNHFALMHVVAAWHQCGGEDRDGLQASHLCHTATCFNPSHLHFESAKQNNARKGCVGVVVTRRGRKYRVCRHEPPCIAEISLASCPRIE
jgi:Zinc-binding loop region of homing endonuclease